jgi:hypothetical protein
LLNIFLGLSGRCHRAPAKASSSTPPDIYPPPPNENMKIRLCNISLLFCVSQPPDTFKKVANCVNYKIKLKQSNFERNAKNILGFEHFYRKYTTLKKIAS